MVKFVLDNNEPQAFLRFGRNIATKQRDNYIPKQRYIVSYSNRTVTMIE